MSDCVCSLLFVCSLQLQLFVTVDLYCRLNDQSIYLFLFRETMLTTSGKLILTLACTSKTSAQTHASHSWWWWKKSNIWLHWLWDCVRAEKCLQKVWWIINCHLHALLMSSGLYSGASIMNECVQTLFVCLPLASFPPFHLKHARHNSTQLISLCVIC